MTYFQRLVVNTLTFISLSVVFPGMIHVRGIMPAIIAAFVLSILNMLVKPVLTILSLPFTLLTFGLFSFVVNAAILQMTSFLWGNELWLLKFLGSGANGCNYVNCQYDRYGSQFIEI